MGKLHPTILLLGEGITEIYYFMSLRDVFGGINIKPDNPKNSSLNELEAKIEEGVEKGYNHIFCVVDMDTKDEAAERAKYDKLKAKYSKPINKIKKGIFCQVEFFETHLCTELFFLYYYRYTSRPYLSQDQLIKDLNKDVYYEKTKEFFTKCKGLHSYFEKKGGSLETAIANADCSMIEKQKSGRQYTYSEFGKLLKRIENIMNE